MQDDRADCMLNARGTFEKGTPSDYFRKRGDARQFE